MKLITAIIRPERLPEVEAAFFRAGVTGMTLTRASAGTAASWRGVACR